MSDGLKYECDGCGACCRTYRVFVSEEDAQREPRIKVEGKRLDDHVATEYWRYQLHPIPFLQSCPFLGEDNRCGIYETRPKVCSNFEAGGGRCQDARTLEGLPPLYAGGVKLTIGSAGPRAVPPGSEKTDSGGAKR